MGSEFESWFKISLYMFSHVGCSLQRLTIIYIILSSCERDRKHGISNMLRFTELFLINSQTWPAPAPIAPSPATLGVSKTNGPDLGWTRDKFFGLQYGPHEAAEGNCNQNHKYESIWIACGLFCRKPCNYFNHTCLPCGGFHFLDPPRNLVSRGWSAAGGVPKYRVCSKSQRYPKIAVAQTPLNLFRLTSGLSSLLVAAWPPNASRAVGMQLHASTLMIMTRMGMQLVKALVVIFYLLRDFCPLPSRVSIEFPFVLFCFDWTRPTWPCPFRILMLRLAIKAILQTDPAGFVVWLGVLCSTWSAVSRGSTLRNWLDAEGDTSKKCVADGNVMVSRCLGLKNSITILSFSF